MSKFSLFKLKKGKVFVWKIKISLKILHLVYCFLSQTNKEIEISISDLFDRRENTKNSIKNILLSLEVLVGLLCLCFTFLFVCIAKAFVKR